MITGCNKVRRSHGECRGLEKSIISNSNRVQPPRQHQQRHIRRHTQSSQNNNHIPTRPELPLVSAILVHLRKELLIALLTTVQTCKEDASTIDREERPDAVELGREDLQHDEGEGELAEGGPDVGAFEGTLGGAHFLELVYWL